MIRVKDEFLGELNPYFTNGTQQTSGVDTILFEDGTTWDRTQMSFEVSHRENGDISLIGSGSADVLWAGVGNQYLSGGAGGGELAARAAINITDDQLRGLKEIQTQLEEAYAGDEHEQTVRLNHEFHRAINVAADSPKLAQLMSQITRYAPESVFPTIEGWPGQSIQDHRRVLSALESHDDKLARAAMSQHLAAGAVPLIEHLVSRGVVADASRTLPFQKGGGSSSGSGGAGPA